MQKTKLGDSRESNLFTFFLKLKPEMIIEAILLYPDLGHAKVGKHLESETKKRKSVI